MSLIAPRASRIAVIVGAAAQDAIMCNAHLIAYANDSLFTGVDNDVGGQTDVVPDVNFPASSRSDRTISQSNKPVADTDVLRRFPLHSRQDRRLFPQAL